MMIEMSTPKTQPRILAINSVSWQFGDFVAPFFGGVLSTPAKNWPNYFTGTIWQTYPYALPGVAVRMACQSGMIFFHAHIFMRPC